MLIYEVSMYYYKFQLIAMYRIDCDRPELPVQVVLQQLKWIKIDCDRFELPPSRYKTLQ
jgi:hypothetical protein